MSFLPKAAARWMQPAALAFWLILSLSPNPRPDPLPVTADPVGFSAERAMAHVTEIARAPHPPGTPEHDRVRDYIRAEFARQGLETQLQTGLAEFTRRGFHFSSQVENIVARRRGLANTRPVMLVAHYDSVRTGPGAGDDGHGVAVLLETLRALNQGPPSQNDIIFLISDGEERGLLGAAFFEREHPWRGEPGVVLNFEARGTGGPAYMFETSAGNAWMIATLKAAVPQAEATSMAYEVYRRMPNDTDLTVFKAAGLAGMNFAFIEHPEYYHRAQDDVAHLDRRSVQEQGRYALLLTRAFANQDLSHRQSGDAIYFATRITGLIVYPASWAQPIAYVTLALLVWVAWTTRRRHRWIAIALAILAILSLVVAIVAPGASYLLEWPVLGGVVSLAMMNLRGLRISKLLLPAPAFLLMVPVLHSLIVALGPRGAAPVVAAVIFGIVICILPQLTESFSHPEGN